MSQRIAGGVVARAIANVTGRATQAQDDDEHDDDKHDDMTEDEDRQDDAAAEDEDDAPEDDDGQGAKSFRDGRQAERRRIAGILGCAEAAGRMESAMHLALRTSLSVADARGALGGLSTSAQSGQSRLGSAMQALGNAAVGDMPAGTARRPKLADRMKHRFAKAS